jgi:hypothetical protein
MDVLLYPLFVVGCILLFVCCFRFFRESSYWGTAWLLFLVTVMVYDNLLILIGDWIGFGDILEMLSMLRYLLHALLVPTLVFVSLDILRRAEVVWVERFAVQMVFYLYTIGLTVAGIFHDFLWVQMEAVSVNGIDRYIIHESPFSWIVIAAFLPLIVTAVVIWRKLQWPILLIGCMFVALCGVVTIISEIYVLGSFTELVLLSVLAVTEYRLKQEDYISNLFEA